MAKVIFYSVPAHGHVNPTIEVVRGLAKRGERVHYYTNAEFFSAFESLGVDLREYEGLSIDNAQNYVQNYFHVGRVVAEFTERLMPALIKEAKELGPDYIIHDSMALWGKCVAQHLGIPAVGSIPTFTIGKQGPRWDLKGLCTTLRMLAMGGHHALRFFQIAKRLGHQYGIKPPQFYDGLVARPDFGVVYTTPDLHPPARGLEDYRFVGPSIRQFSGREVTLPAGKKAYISLGTIHENKGSFYRACMDAFQELPLTFLLNTNDPVESLGLVPKNFLVRKGFPQVQVLKKVQAFVTHCGMNSVHEALNEGVPLVMVPQSPEQQVVAEQVEKNGAGVWVRKVSPSSLLKALKRVLNDPRFRENAGRLSEGFKQAGGAPRAVDEILSYVGHAVAKSNRFGQDACHGPEI